MQILPNGRVQFIDSSGAPLASGNVGFYSPGTLNPLTTYQDQAGTIPNANPVPLDSRGQALIWGSGIFRQILKDASGVTIWDALTQSSDATFSGSGGAALIGFDGTNLAVQLQTRINRVVDSVAALRALSKITYTRAFVTGYYLPHDGGGGAYQYDPADTTTADNGGTVIVAADGARWKLSQTAPISFKQFGVKGDGTTDDTASINLALVGIGTGTLFFPSGTYMTTGNHTLPAGVYIVGSGQLATTISSTSLTADVFLMAASDSGVRDLTITGLVTRTAGRFIATTGGQGGPNIIRDITYTNYFIGIQLNSARTFVDNITAINACSTSSQVISVVNASDIFIRNVSADTSIKPAFGLLVTKASGLWVSDCDFIHCTVGVALTPSGSDQIIDCFFSNVAADSCGNNAWNLSTSGTAVIYSCAFENCWGASATNYGFVTQGVGGVIDTLYFSNWNCVNNGLEGTYFQSGTRNVTMVGGVVSGNSLTSGTSNGIRIGPNLNGFSIVGMKVGPAQNLPDTQINQIVVEAGIGANINIANCDLSTAGHTPITFSATGTNNSVSNCGGMQTKGFVTATTNAASQLLVAHGLGGIPKEVFITESNSGAVLKVQPTAFTATNFLVTAWVGGTLAPSTSISFSWRVEL